MAEQPADKERHLRRITQGIVAAYLLLAVLSSRAGEFLPAVEMLYALPMIYSMLRMDRSRLAILAGFALMTHGTAVFMLIEREHHLNQPALWVAFAALALVFAWSVYAAGAVLTLRERLAETRRRLHDLGEEASERAGRDELTGVVHQRHLIDALEREIARSERIGKPLSVARVDLDWLGSVNENYGDGTGDIALKLFTSAATGALRDVDVFGRYSGKEFLAVMPDTDLKGSVIAAERLRAAVARQPVPEVRGRRHLSCSLGVAEHRRGENTRLLIGRAEAALSYAKAAGRDRVVALGADGKPVLVGSA